MDTLIAFLLPLTVWHWLAFGLILIGIEVMTGTFDLLWAGVGAFATALFKAFAPASIAGPEGQFVFFAIAAIGLIILGRTTFSQMRRVASDRPQLNKRMESLVGATGRVTEDIEGGAGRVKIGDTEWLAGGAEGADIAKGTTVIVEDTRSTAVIVRPA